MEVESVFARYGIPLYYAHRSDILKSPVLTLLLGALDAQLEAGEELAEPLTMELVDELQACAIRLNSADPA